jgi:hypothetical protein
MSSFWTSFVEWFASISAVTAVVFTLAQLSSNRTYYAALHYLNHCDVARQNPQFANPALGKLDLQSKTFDGDPRQFESYEWYVARLVYALDVAMRLAPFQEWKAVARSQLANHKAYFASDHYVKQDYLKHYSSRMRKLILQQRAA